MSPLHFAVSVTVPSLTVALTGQYSPALITAFKRAAMLEAVSDLAIATA